jgi:glycosyltransferase involved in cell wall biosynthesis
MQIVRSLKEQFVFDIVLFTKEEKDYDEEFLTYGGKIYRIPYYEGNSYLRQRIDYTIRGLYIFHGINKILRLNEHYHAIHCNNSFEAGLCVTAARMHGIPIRIVHSHAVCPKYNFIRRNINHIYQFLINTNSTVKIGCSEKANRSLFGKTEGSSLFLNIYNEKLFDRTRYPSQIKERLILTQVGYYCSNKNQLYSLKILSKLVEKYPDALLQFVGFDGEEYVLEMKKYISEHNLQSNVFFFPSNTDIPKLLSVTVAYLCPSVSEGFGIVLVEAQAMGVKCYVSDTVPCDANVGGCDYISLEKGPEFWALKIIEDFPDNQKCHSEYICDKFKTNTQMERLREYYK